MTQDRRAPAGAAQAGRCVAGGLALWAALATAAPVPAAALEVNDYADLGRFIADVSTRHGFTIAQLVDWFSQVEIKPSIVEAMERPKESLPWHEYEKLFLTDDRIKGGAEFWKKNRDALTRAYKEYGVDPEIVVAIIGVETRYGRQTGGFRVLDALTTLSFNYPKRAEFFRGQLEEYLLLTRELRIDPLKLKGSYAGAMGMPQFIPSSYRNYAVDFDGDGRPDILGSTADAIGSVAHYLKSFGWQRNEPVIDEVRIEDSHYAWLESNSIEPLVTVKELRRYGVAPVGNIDLKRLATLITLETEDGPSHRLGYNNFYVITRYNRSTRYAMAVYELSQLIRAQYEKQP